jgi:DNA-directed RNA polymerase subunit beta'
MPHTEDGKVIDVMMNPTGIPSRINPSQVHETVAGKVAEATGRTFTVRNFSGEDYVESVNRAAKSAGVRDKEDLVDPSSGRRIPAVNVGNQYVLKLDHPTRKKFSARAQGPGYTAELQPTRGKHEGGQSLDALTLYSMLSHGSLHNLREMATYKAEKNDEVWRALQMGQALPAPQSTFAFQKFTDMLRGSGVNVQKDGNQLSLSPLTDKHTLEQSEGEVKNSQVVRGKDLRPEKGGLFDPTITGGVQGDRWNHIKLSEPMPNPVFENAIKSILDMKQQAYDDLIGGKRWVDQQGRVFLEPAEGRVTGGKAFQVLLKKVQPEQEIARLMELSKKKKGPELDKINKKIRYLRALQENKIKPQDYVVQNVPVIPARLRPVYALADGSLDVTEVNHLYRDLIEVNNHSKEYEKLGMPEQEKAQLRDSTYQAMKAVAGLAPSIDGRNRKGLIDQIRGNTNKEGFFQNRIMRRRQEMTGRSTIVPDPELGLDQVAIPEEMAWKVYQPHVVRNLHQQGYKPLDAREQMEKRTPLAKKALEVAMRERPVMLNRAPSLHKFSVMGFMPQLTTGKAIKINPLVVKGYNADFDGDTMSVHVPVSEDAKQESLRMLPSRNLWGPRTGELMNHPSLEAVVGLYMHTHTKKGRDEVNALLPKGWKVTGPMTEKSMMAMLGDIGKKKPGAFTRVVNGLKDIGNRESFHRGLTVGMEDLQFDPRVKKRIFAEADKKARKKGNTDDAIVEAYTEASKKLDAAIMSDKRMAANGFRIMSDSGAKGNRSQIRQILAAPVLVQDISGKTVPVPIKRSYAEGLDMGDYWASMSGARKGMIDRALQTSEPGALSKELLNSTLSEVIAKADCGTTRGTEILLTDRDISDRYLAKTVRGVGRRNDLVTHHMLAKAKKMKVNALLVRSPLTCAVPQGICQKCYGLDESGKPPAIGENVGVKAGQAIGERATQLTMRTFHTGAAAGGGSLTAGFQRVKEVLEMPKKLRNQATLARKAGKIDSIKTSPIGGWDVMIGDEKHHVPASRRMLVKKGQKVKAGDSLSDGAISPQELLELKGMRETQDYLVGQVVGEYGNQGIKINRKIAETAIRPLTNMATVLQHGGHETLVPGDHAPMAEIEDFNRRQNDPNRRIKAQPLLRGINTRPLVSEDWLSRLNFQRLHQTIQEGAAQSWKTDVASPYAPLAAYAYGPHIGKKKP